MARDKKRFAERLLEMLLLLIVGIFVVVYVYASFTTGPNPSVDQIVPSE